MFNSKLRRERSFVKPKQTLELPEFEHLCRQTPVRVDKMTSPDSSKASKSKLTYSQSDRCSTRPNFLRVLESSPQFRRQLLRNNLENRKSRSWDDFNLRSDTNKIYVHSDTTMTAIVGNNSDINVNRKKSASFFQIDEVCDKNVHFTKVIQELKGRKFRDKEKANALLTCCRYDLSRVELTDKSLPVSIVAQVERWKMSESNVRSWIRSIRFTPENYDQSVFYVSHNDTTVSSSSSESNPSGCNTSSKLDLGQKEIKNLTSFKPSGSSPESSTMINTFPPTLSNNPRRNVRMYKPHTINTCGFSSRPSSIILESIAEQDVEYSSSKNSSNRSSYSEGSRAPDRNPSEICDFTSTSANTIRVNSKRDICCHNNKSLLTINNVKCESETCSFMDHKGDDDSIYLHKNVSSNIEDNDLSNTTTDDDASDESFDLPRNSCECFDDSGDEISSPQRVISASDSPEKSVFKKYDLKEELIMENFCSSEKNEDINSCEEEVDISDCVHQEPIYENLIRSESSSDESNFDEDIVMRNPSWAFKRNTESFRRNRYAILDDPLKKKFELRMKVVPITNLDDPNEHLDIYENVSFSQSKKSDDSSDTISWKSTTSTLFSEIACKGSTPPYQAVEEHEDDVSSDSLSWLSTSSFAPPRKTEQQDEKVFQRGIESRNDKTPPEFDVVYANIEIDGSGSCLDDPLSKESTMMTFSASENSGIVTNNGAHLIESEIEVETINGETYESRGNSVQVRTQLMVKFAKICLQRAEYQVVQEFYVAPLRYAQVDFGDVLQWQKDIAGQYFEEIEEYQEYTSLESIQGKKERVSPFPTEHDVEIRKKSDDRSVGYRSQTIHGYVTESEDSKKNRPLNMNNVTKIYYEGTVRKISKNNILRILNGNMMLLNDKGEIEILNDNVHITHYKPISKKEIQITNTTTEECKLYKLQFDNPKDKNAVLGELHKYFNNNLQERPRSNSLTDKPCVTQIPQSEERVQIRHRLLKLLGRRSSKDMLEKKGIIRNEPIFGNSLNNLYKKYHLPVPNFVVKVINIIELPKNITSLGLYRASGNLATIQKIRFQVDRNNLRILDEYKGDIDVLTGALKLFFRELKEPVIPHKTYEELLKFVDKDLDSSMINQIKYSINKMEMPHKETFLTLLRHLVQVEKFKQENKMDAYNISIVWGPTMIWPPETSQENILQNHTNANKIIEMLLNIFRTDFLKDSKEPSQSGTENKLTSYPESNEYIQEQSKSSTKKESPESNSTKSNMKVKFGSMENLFKSIKRDSPTSPKDLKWNLDNICKNSKDNIPSVLLRAIPVIEKNIKTEHLYSKEITLEKIEKIRSKIIRNKYGSLEKSDIYDLAALVKLFIAELDPPLIPTEIFLKMVQAVGKQNEMEKTKIFKTEINKLSIHHKETISYLFKHFVKICRQKEVNMTCHAMAVAWAPVIAKKLVETSEVRFEKCTEVIQYLIEFHDENSVVAVDLVENLKVNLIAYNENYQKFGKACVKSLSSQNNNNSSCESIPEQELTNNNGPVIKRILKNPSALHRTSKYFNSGQHPPSIYDNVPSTQIPSSRENVRGEAKLLETDTNKNVKTLERTTKL